MNCLYLAPAARLIGREIGAHQALTCPDPTMCLVMVERWVSDVAQDAFEAFPDVVPLFAWDGGKLVPAALLAAFSKGLPVANLSALDTLGSALWKIRAAWPAARY